MHRAPVHAEPHLQRRGLLLFAEPGDVSRRLGPFVSEAIDQWRRWQERGERVSARRIEVFGKVACAIQELGFARDHAAQHIGGCEHGGFLPEAKRELHFLRVTPSRPRQHEREQTEEQELRAERHLCGLRATGSDRAHASFHRYPIPYMVSMLSKAGSIAWNLRRMRLTCEVIVLSSSTTFAASISCCRFFTCPGFFASACTIQNSVSVRPSGLSFHEALSRAASIASSPRVRTWSRSEGCVSASMRRKSALTRATRCVRLMSFVR